MAFNLSAFDTSALSLAGSLVQQTNLFQQQAATQLNGGIPGVRNNVYAQAVGQTAVTAAPGGSGVQKVVAPAVEPSIVIQNGLNADTAALSAALETFNNAETAGLKALAALSESDNLLKDTEQRLQGLTDPSLTDAQRAELTAATLAGLEGINALAQAADYNGINLLTGDTISVPTTADGQQITVSGKAITASVEININTWTPPPVQTESGRIDVTNATSTDQGFQITGRSINADGSLSQASVDNVTVRPVGIGVAGGSSRLPELDYNTQQGTSEQLVVDFDNQVTDATVSLSQIYGGEAGGEAGTATLYRNGEAVGTVDFASSGNNTNLEVSLAAEDGGTFDRIVFEATPNGSSGYDNSDYSIQAIDYNYIPGTTGGSQPQTVETDVTIDGSSGLSGELYSVTGRSINADGSLSDASALNVAQSNAGIGVQGGVSHINQVGYNANLNTSEQLIFSFEGQVTQASADISKLYASENGGEVGQYQLLRDGEVVGTGSFQAQHGNTATVDFQTADGGTFDQIVFSAAPHANGNRPNYTGQSDFYVESLTATVQQQVAPGPVERQGSIDSSNALSGENFQVLGRSLNADGTLSEASASNVSTSSLGIGVQGGESLLNQVGYNADLENSEELIFRFDDQVTQASVEVDKLYASELGGEVGAYQLFRNGELVGESTFQAESGRTTTLDLQAADGGTFDEIVFSAQPHATGDSEIYNGQSDYYISNVDFTYLDGATPPPNTQSITREITADNVLSQNNDFTVSAQSVLPNGELSQPSSLFVTTSGGSIGVLGGDSRINQIEYNAEAGQSETLSFDFNKDLSSAEVDVSRLFSNEGNGGEVGTYQLYSNGELVGSGSFQADSGDTATVSLTADNGGTFDQIVFGASDYGNGGNNGQDSSDYYIDALRYTFNEAVTPPPGETPGGVDFTKQYLADGFVSLTNDLDAAKTQISRDIGLLQQQGSLVNEFRNLINDALGNLANQSLNAQSARSASASIAEQLSTLGASLSNSSTQAFADSFTSYQSGLAASTQSSSSDTQSGSFQSFRGRLGFNSSLLAAE